MKDAMARTRGRVDANPILLRRRIRHIAAELEFLEELETSFAIPVHDETTFVHPAALRGAPEAPSSTKAKKK